MTKCNNVSFFSLDKVLRPFWIAIKKIEVEENETKKESTYYNHINNPGHLPVSGAAYAKGRRNGYICRGAVQGYCVEADNADRGRK